MQPPSTHWSRPPRRFGGVSNSSCTHHKTLTVNGPAGRVRVTFDIVADEDDPHALLAAYDGNGEALAQVRVDAGFRFSAASVNAWISLPPTWRIIGARLLVILPGILRALARATSRTGDFAIMNQAIDSTPIATTERALARAHALASAFLASLPERPVSHVPSPEEMAAALDEALPETGSDPAAVLDDWFARAERGITASPGPRFFGFVTGGVTPAALAGDWLASAIDQNAGLWASSPAAGQTELVVLRWLKELFGLPAAWSGALTSGATMANLVGLIAARQWAGAAVGRPATRLRRVG